MPFFLVMALVLPCGLSAAVLLKRRFEEVVALVFLGIMAAGYLLGLAGAVWLTPWLLYGAVAAALAHLVYVFAIRRSAKVKGLFSLGLFVFIALAVLLWWLCRGRMLTFWDDFTHWGLSVKNMFYWDALHTAPTSSAIDYRDYPPGSPIVQYVFLKACRLPFREDVALFVHSLLALSMLVYPLGRFKAKNTLMGCGLAALLFLALPGLNAGAYSRLLVDGLMGVMVAYVLLAAYLSGRRLHGVLCTVLGCFALSITKAAGAGLAAMAGLAVLACWLFMERPAFKEALRKNKAGALLAAGGPLLAVVLGQLSWALHKAAVGIGQQGQNPEWLAQLWQMVTGTAPEYRYQVVGRFFSTFFTNPFNGHSFMFPSAVWFLVYAAFFAATFFLLEKGRRKRYVFFGVWVAGMHVVFMLGLLFSYLFSFSSSEAVSMASFHRYEASVVTACMLFYVAALFTAAVKRRIPAQLSAALLSAAAVYGLCCNVPYFIKTIPSAPVLAAESQQQRHLSGLSAQRIQALGEATPRVYMISMIDNRWALIQLIYELVPVNLSNQHQRTSIATGIYYGDTTLIHTEILTPEDWGQILYSDYDYVYLYNIDGYFTTYYRPLFEEEDDIVNDVMLQVVRHEDGTVTLRRL